MEFWIKGDMLLPQLRTIQSLKKKKKKNGPLWRTSVHLLFASFHLPLSQLSSSDWPFVDRRFEQQRGGAAGYEITNIRNSCSHWCHSDSREKEKKKKKHSLNLTLGLEKGLKLWPCFISTTVTAHIWKKIRREHNRSSLRTTLNTLHLFVHVLFMSNLCASC